MSWSGGLVEWDDNEIAYISVVFSWQREKAYQRAVWLKAEGYEVWVGGPAAYYDPRFFQDVAFVAPSKDEVVWRHNPDATFTTRGCVRDCPFCIVPISEPGYKELIGWPVRPIVCDNNLLASSIAHFDIVIDKLSALRNVDFNQGLDARLLTKHHAEQIRRLDMWKVRLAWDWIGMENDWMRAFELLIDAGIPKSKIQTYVLIGFNDTPEDALYRLETVKSLGVLPNPMRYQPLDANKRNSYVHPNWTDRELKRYMRYWSRQRWLRPVPFKDYWG